MGAPHLPNRREIVRYGRRYVACGVRGYRAANRHAFRARAGHVAWFAGSRAGLLPGATLALIVLFSFYVLGYPPIQPDNPQHRTPIVGVSHYSFADFANANH